ncbi:MAG: hypothetical protein ABSG68_12615 [Thermoguttaceae bacterium]|jgi:photosystem II stability/assembly factor-like uncharacterized protein
MIRASLLAAFLAGTQIAAAAKIVWQPLGLTGNGGMFAPAISPLDPKMIMLNCDMSGAYLSRDGGAHWRIIYQGQLRSSTRCRGAFHPSDARIIFAAQAGQGMKVSRDGGEHWQAVPGTPQDLCGEIAIDPGDPQRMMAGDRQSVVLSRDGGKTWHACQGPHGQTVAFHFGPAGPAARRCCFAASSEGVWRSDDGGATWTEKTAGLPWRGIRSFAGGSRPDDGLTILYCALPSRIVDGRFGGGVFRSTDRGESWTSVMGDRINMDITPADQWAHEPIAQYQWVLTTSVDPRIVYALNSNTGVHPPHHTADFRSDDAGEHWRATFYPDPRFKICNAEPDFNTVADGQFYQQPAFGAAIDAANPDHLIHVSDWVYLTNDGGKSWQCGHARRVGGGRTDATWSCNGLVVTTAWNFYIDPFQPRRHYIAYTDIGLGRSLDAGQTWTWWGRSRSPWRNTCYELAFDPQTPGKIWGAFSNTHDIPNGNIIHGGHRANLPGGVCLSTDFGDTWKPIGAGLPAAPCLSIVLDPKSPAGRRTLYTSMFGQGVFKSADDGRTWRPASAGLGAPANMRVCRLQLHSDGSLFVLITAMKSGGQFLKEGAGLYRSTDAAAHWKLVNAARRLYWPKDFTVDPDDSRTIYIGAADGRADQAGLWRTRDGGTTWQRLAKRGPEHFGAYLHPAHKGWIYMTLTEDAPGAGLWLSKDDGQTWTPMRLPFANAQRVSFDPADDSVIYVATFGGSVWKGPASE